MILNVLILSFNENYNCNLKAILYGVRKNAPGNKALGKIAPRKITPRKYAPRKIAPGK